MHTGEQIILIIHDIAWGGILLHELARNASISPFTFFESVRNNKNLVDARR
jgi:hypothetical protein